MGTEKSNFYFQFTILRDFQNTLAESDTEQRQGRVQDWTDCCYKPRPENPLNEMHENLKSPQLPKVNIQRLNIREE